MAIMRWSKENLEKKIKELKKVRAGLAELKAAKQIERIDASIVRLEDELKVI